MSANDTPFHVFGVNHQLDADGKPIETGSGSAAYANAKEPPRPLKTSR